MHTKLAIVWLRQDLRLADNPALAAAADAESVLPVYIDEPADAHALGAASRAWTHRSLDALGEVLTELGAPPLYARGEPGALLEALIETAVARGTARTAIGVFWNRRYTPTGIETDKRVKAALAERLEGRAPRTFKAALLHEPWEALKGDGTPYRVYTPYWKGVLKRLGDVPEPLPAPVAFGAGAPGLVQALAEHGFSGDLDALELVAGKGWETSMLAHWPVGEVGARARLETFVDGGAVHGYDSGRDLPGSDFTSRLSPHLHHGELSARQVLARTLAGRDPDALDEGETTFVKELVWREFAATMLYHYPDTVSRPLDRRFERFEWNAEPEAPLAAWRRGRTGVPIVDAGMRQLRATGWMHNRVRMVVASYLIKNLLIDWREGEAWFRDTLVDADLASNVLGWQWAAGCGADAAPFFRVFNPVLQGEKFDRDGAYARAWVPELADVPKRHLHKPWELASSPPDYPAPLVDLKASRQRALDAFAALKRPAS